MVYGEEVTKRKEGVFSWSELIRLGNSTSDTIINARLTNIAINQVSKIIPNYFAMHTLNHIHAQARQLVPNPNLLCMSLIVWMWFNVHQFGDQDSQRVQLYDILT